VSDMKLDTGTGEKRKSMTLDEALVGYQPTPFTKEEWHAMHMTSRTLMQEALKR
jgi:hypothetical protein